MEVRKEWEEDDDTSNGIRHLFALPDDTSTTESKIIIGNIEFSFESISYENKHITPQTGLIFWDGSRCLTKFITNCTELFKDKNIIELGCGILPLPSMMASLVGAKKCIATDGSRKILEIAKKNIKKNMDNIEKSAWCLSIACSVDIDLLKWGNKENHIEILENNTDGFDLIMGADVVYSESGVKDLFTTVSILMQVNRQISRLLLCFVIRGVGENKILSIANDSGLELCILDYTIAKAIRLVKEEESHVPIRFLYFKCINKSCLN